MLGREHGLLFLCILAACLVGIATRPIAFMATFWPANGLLLGLMLRNPVWSKTPLAWLSAWLGFVAADALTGATLERNLVINTTQGAQAVVDSFSIRREALMHNIAYYTTVAGAKAVVDSIIALREHELGVKSLQDYLK